jgi:hypothetical protein
MVDGTEKAKGWWQENLTEGNGGNKRETPNLKSKFQTTKPNLGPATR